MHPLGFCFQIYEKIKDKINTETVRLRTNGKASLKKKSHNEINTKFSTHNYGLYTRPDSSRKRSKYHAYVAFDSSERKMVQCWRLARPFRKDYKRI